MRPYIISLVLISAALSCADISFADTTGKILDTKYTKIHYVDDRDLADFTWRIGGQKPALPGEESIVVGRVDRIVERVETILDMCPRHFKFNIYLKRGKLDLDRIAFYDKRSRSVYISVDFASDGVFAHEAAHAVIAQYLPASAPTKIQEILTQYVDKYLWNDY
jgi:hypothetical protein